MALTSPAAVIMAMYVGVADKTGVERAALSGTIQNDILKEYQAQKEFVFPPRPSMRLVRDTIAFTAAEMPKWNSISVSGYHIREAGSTAVEEWAFTRPPGSPSSSTPPSTSSKRSPSTARPGASGRPG